MDSRRYLVYAGMLARALQKLESVNILKLLKRQAQQEFKFLNERREEETKKRKNIV